MKALIIDDEKDVCYLLMAILKQKNLYSACVNRIADAPGALEKEEPSIVFLDNQLPDGLGIEFIDYIKKTHPAVKIVMITAHDSTEDKRNALNKGADLFLGKPFSRDAIGEAVDHLCE